MNKRGFSLTLASLFALFIEVKSQAEEVRSYIGISARYSLIKLSDKLALDIRILPELYTGTDIRVKGYKWYKIAKFGNFLLQSTIGIKYYFKGI